MITDLTADEARKIWRYDSETGKFFWLVSPRYRVEVGSRAGYTDGRYRRLAWKGKQYKASRVAWLIITGQWPKEQIDHINRDKMDDRFINLREATNAENCRNKPVRENNKVGIKGVSLASRGRGFVAQIGKNGKTIYLGYFSTPEEARAAYITAAKELHGQFAELGA